MNFATTCFIRSCIKILDTVVLGIPRSASSSLTVSRWPLMIAAHTHSTFSGVLLVTGLPECGSLSTDSQPSLKHLYQIFICTALIALSRKAFWITWTVSAEECSSLMENLMQIHCSTCSFWMRWPHSTHAHSTPLTSTVKSSLLTHAYSSPLS